MANGLYLRLSIADGDLGKENKDESNSIDNQRSLLVSFITDREDMSDEYIEYVDDGYSGTNFDRPAFKKMIEDAKAGKIDTVIVKDFSRFGRDYIGVGDYLEQVFPLLGIRFISLNNNYDSKEYIGKTMGLDMAINNLVNNLYSKDISKKLKSALKVKWKNGKWTGSKPPFGYLKDEEHGCWKIDPVAGKYVRMIFDKAMEGCNTSQICYYMNEQKVPTLFTIIEDKEVDYELPFLEFIEGADHRKIEIRVSYPGTKMILVIKDEEFLRKNPKVKRIVEIKAQNLYMFSAKSIVSREEYEILYIGQSYGKKGRRTALDRLEAHSTLQKILTEYKEEHPDKHIYILLLEMEARLAMSFDGISKKFTKSEDESMEHLKKVCSDLPKEEQIINIVEAAMINYFKPEYNVNFVENFPDKNHKGYRQYFDLDYNMLTIEIDLSFDDAPSVQFYTSTNKVTSSLDFIRYKLFNDNTRKSMYDIFEKDAE